MTAELSGQQSFNGRLGGCCFCLAAGIMDQVFMVNLVFTPREIMEKLDDSLDDYRRFPVVIHEFQLCGWTWRNWSEVVRFEKRISVKSCLTTWLTCLFQDKKEEYETINQQPLGRLVRIDHLQLMVTGIWGDLKVVRNGQNKKHHNFEFVGELSNTGTICNNLGLPNFFGVLTLRCEFFVEALYPQRY